MSKTLGENCKWALTWNGEKVDLGESLDEQLDSFLLNHLDEVTVEENAVFYSKMSPQELADKNISKIKSAVDSIKVPLKSSEALKTTGILEEESDPDDLEKYYIPNSMGITKVISTLDINDGPLITPMDIEKWKSKKIADLKSGVKLTTVDGKELQDYLKTNSAEKLVQMEEDSWEDLTENGTKVHSILEAVFRGEENSSNPGFEDSIYKAILSQALDFKKSLEKTYPGCKFYPELSIKSNWESLSPKMQAVLKANNLESINGIIDLLVVDSKGVGHIYDYKVSRKGLAPEGVSDDVYQSYWSNPSNEQTQKLHLWGSAKKNSAGYQVEFYRQMCESYGLKVRDTNIVPIKLDMIYEDALNPFKATLKGVTLPTESHIITDPSRGRKEKVNTLFVKPASQSIDDLDSMSSAFNAFFPSQGWTKERENTRNSIDYYKQHSKYVRKLAKDDKNYKVGEKETIIWFPGVTKPIYCANDQVDNKLNELISDQKNRQSAKYLSFADAIQSVMEGKDREVLLGQVGTAQRNFIESTFGKYIDGEWTLASDDSTNSLGILVFRKGDKSEVVCISNEALRVQVALSQGTSLLGQTKADKYIDSRKTLPALQGNLLLMKGMLYISQHEDIFKEYPISNIKAVNPWQGTEHYETNSTLIKNYSDLIKEHPSSRATNIDDSLFMTDLESIIDQAGELVNNLSWAKQSEDYATADWFERTIEQFKRDYSKQLNLKGGFQNTPENNALALLQEGLLIARGFRGHIEGDKGDFVNRKFYELDGLMISSPQYSSSANIRELGQAIDEYAKEVRKQIFTIGAPIQQAFRKVYEKYGTGAKVFSSWFDNSEENKGRLILKNPDSVEFNGDPVMREALDTFLKTMCKLRHPEYTTEEQFENAKLDEDYYAIPLLEAKFSRQVKGVGLWKALKNKFTENLTVTKDLFMGDKDPMLEQYGSVSDYVSENQEIYNKLKYDNMDARDAQLARYGAGMCETDLEIVMNAMLYSFCRSNVSKQYIPIISALKTCLDRADALGGTKKSNMDNIRKRFDDIVKTKLYGESIVSPQIQPLLKWLNLIKSGFTTLTLSLNVRSFLRESLQGIYTGVSRAGVKMYPGIDEKHYIEGLTYVIQDASKNFSGVSLLQQMNSVYGMANQSLTQIAGQRRLNWAHINHWGKDTLFITATGPDFMHRMGLLVAKMKSDGCFEAHKLGPDGVLVYDWKADKRFEHYAKGDTSNENYLKEKSLYLSMIEDFNTAGFKNSDGSSLKEGDDLPQAYTRSEGQSVKNYADLLYGHYDEESKSLLYDTFAGAIFLQYKTYLTSKLEQWTMHEGIYNIATLEQQKDENGNEMYVKFYEDEDGTPHKDILLKGEYEALSEEEKGKCRLYYDYNGLPMQGMLQESCKVYKKLLTLDKKGLEEIWKDPTTRAMFKLQLHDLWLMAFLTALVNLIFGNAEDVDNPMVNPNKVYQAVRKSGPVESFTYNVLSGSMSDSQLGNILGSFTDKPPMISALNRFGKTSMQMITGDASVTYWLTRNIGMIGDFQGMAEAYDKAKK